MYTSCAFGEEKEPSTRVPCTARGPSLEGSGLLSGWSAPPDTSHTSPKGCIHTYIYRYRLSAFFHSLSPSLSLFFFFFLPLRPFHGHKHWKRQHRPYIITCVLNLNTADAHRGRGRRGINKDPPPPPTPYFPCSLLPDQAMSNVVSEHYPPVVSWSSPATSLPYHKQPRNSETRNWRRLRVWGGGVGGVGEGL